jgi:hypothetical protein
LVGKSLGLDRKISIETGFGVLKMLSSPRNRGNPGNIYKPKPKSSAKVVAC